MGEKALSKSEKMLFCCLCVINEKRYDYDHQGSLCVCMFYSQTCFGIVFSFHVSYCCIAMYIYSLKREISTEIVPITMMLMSICMRKCVCLCVFVFILLCTAGEIVLE